MPKTSGGGTDPQHGAGHARTGTPCTHRVSSGSEGDGLHVVVGNDLQGREFVGRSQELLGTQPETAPPPCHIPPGAGPARGLTRLWSPGYESQATRKRVGTPTGPLRAGSKPGDLAPGQGTWGLTVPKARSCKARGVWLQPLHPRGLGGGGHSAGHAAHPDIPHRGWGHPLPQQGPESWT